MSSERVSDPQRTQIMLSTSTHRRRHSGRRTQHHGKLADEKATPLTPCFEASNCARPSLLKYLPTYLMYLFRAYFRIHPQAATSAHSQHRGPLIEAISVNVTAFGEKGML